MYHGILINPAQVTAKTREEKEISKNLIMLIVFIAVFAVLIFAYIRMNTIDW